MLPEPVARFRAAYREHDIPAHYSGALNLWITFGGGAAALIACLAQLDGVTRAEWLIVPVAFLYANLVEYFGHRFPMHRPFPGLKLIYRRHAGQHHRFFTDEAMPLDESRDLRAVLFPPLLVVFFFGGFALPAWFVLAQAASANVAWLMLATGIGYFLNYEFLHLAYHQPPGHWMTRVPGVARLSWLHRHHHDPRVMASRNFNITWPISDWLFGTLERPRDGSRPRQD
jgi:phosphatidylglycerophosphate synthase